MRADEETAESSRNGKVSVSANRSIVLRAHVLQFNPPPGDGDDGREEENEEGEEAGTTTERSLSSLLTFFSEPAGLADVA